MPSPPSPPSPPAAPRPMDFPIAERGRRFEDFTVGQRFEHHWGRTIAAAEATMFATLTLAYCPLYFNAEHARAEGHPDLLVHPMLVLCTVVGQSVEDLSEIGGPFLGIDDLTFTDSVYPGDTISARSVVVEARVVDFADDPFLHTDDVAGGGYFGRAAILEPCVG